ncbi:QcrA and Rieske domain-containing protein [Halosimplex salinum]|uniref:QcrA and Rieske domain-containing protein n=1 Tax=Halosimplex salinum TaxID=1710538 RepID=UPI000F4917BE|nr:Rieske (2Fe-2S) protein [Halosimplex salinum]
MTDDDIDPQAIADIDCPCTYRAVTDGGTGPTDTSDGPPDETGPEGDGDDGRFERRDVAKFLATVGGLTAVGSLAAPLAGLTQVFERGYSGPVYTDNVALVDEEGEPVEEGRLNPGEQMTVFPETNPGIEDAPTLLVRFEEGEYTDATNAEFTVSGYAAYSKVCTHAGCMVSNRENSTLVCPCHAGKFDPLSGARVVGGPPPRPLPQLPLALADEGYLVATGDFPSPIGVED